MSFLYDQFHKNTKTLKKVINEDDFTYINVISSLKGYIKRNNDVLDIGCGVGSIDFYLANRGMKVLGLDSSQKAIDQAELNSEALGLKDKTTFKKIDAGNIYLDRKFDLIILSEVLEHVPNDIVLLKKIYKLLKNRGVLFISVPSLNAPLYKIGLLKNFDKRVGHLRRYSVGWFKNKLPKLGFKLERVSLFESLLRNALFNLTGINFVVRFIKGPFSRLINYIDKSTVSVLGESQIILIASKK